MHGRCEIKAVGSNAHYLALSQEQRDLVWKHLWLVDSVADQLQFDSDEVADFGLETLCKIVRVYDPSRGSFKTFATICLRRAFIHRKSHDEGFVQISQLLKYCKVEGQAVPASQWECIPYGFFIAEQMEVEESNNGQFGEIDLQMLDALRSKIKADDWAILEEYFINGDTIEKIGIRRGVLRQSMSERLKRILKQCNPMYQRDLRTK